MTQARGRKPQNVAEGWTDYRRGDKPTVRRMQLYMHQTLFARLQDLARADGLPLSGVVRSLVCDGLAARAKNGTGSQNGAGAP